MFAFLVAARLSVLAPVHPEPEPLVAYVLHFPLPRRMSAWSRCACCCCCCRCCCRCLLVFFPVSPPRFLVPIYKRLGELTPPSPFFRLLYCC
jgi:hypothetical protein